MIKARWHPSNRRCCVELLITWLFSMVFSLPSLRRSSLPDSTSVFFFVLFFKCSYTLIHFLWSRCDTAQSLLKLFYFDAEHPAGKTRLRETLESFKISWAVAVVTSGWMNPTERTESSPL